MSLSQIARLVSLKFAIKFMMQKSGTHPSEKQLRQAEQRFEKLFRSSPIGIAIVDTHGRFLHLNDSALILFGFSREEMIGRTALELNIWTHPSDQKRFESLLHEDAAAREIEMEYRSKSGEIHKVLTSFQSIEINGEDTVLTFFQDRTRQREAEEALTRSQATETEERIQAEALRDIAAVLTSTLELPSVLKLILETIGRIVPHDAASIMLIEGDVARVDYSHGYPAHVVSLFENYRFPLSKMPNLRQMLETGKPHLVADTSTASEWANLAVPGTEWSRSFLGAPIRSRGRVIGFLNLDSARASYYTPTHAERLQAFADQASVAIQNAFLYDEVSRHASELEQRVEQRTIELQHAKEHIEAIFNTSGDGIILIDSEGKIRQANSAFKQMFNFSEEVFYKSFQSFVEPSEHKKYADAVFNVTQQHEPVRVVLSCLRSDGSRFDADAVLTPLLDKDGAVGIICNLHDISQHKQLEAELRAALEKEKELNELKSRFITTVSHEFRTPFAIISTKSQLLKKHSAQMSIQRQQEHFDKIEFQIRHLTEMMECVLFINQADSAGIAFKPEPLNIERFCQSVVEDIRPTIPTHEIQFSTKTNCEQALIDPKLMRSVLYNLLSNAVKYSQQGSVVSLELSCNQTAAIIRITDQGIGIPEADLKHLFEAFHRASNVGTIQGTGLGLAIVKRAVEAHQGSIRVESTVGKGTSFVVTIPLSLQK